MRIAIFWAEYLHYHVARINALFELPEWARHEICAFGLSPRARDLPDFGYWRLLGDRVRILCNDPTRSGPYSWASKRQILGYLDSSQPDVVAIIGYDGKVSRAALGWCRLHRKGAVLMLPSQEKDVPRLFWKEGIKSALVRCYDAVLAAGSAHSRYAVKLGAARERTFIGYEAVDNEFWNQAAQKARSAPEPWIKKFNLPDKFFLTVGRFVAKKNFSGLLRAYANFVIRAESAPWSLVLVGDGELRATLETLAEDLGLRGLVRFTGYLGAEDLAAVYGLASAFVLPSSYNEQWGLVVNEAMAASLPVLVSSACGCAADLVKDGITGFSFEPLDGAQITRLLLRLCDGGVDLAQMGNNAYKLIEECYSPQAFARGLLSAAEAAVAHASARRWRIWPSPWLWP